MSKPSIVNNGSHMLTVLGFMLTRFISKLRMKISANILITIAYILILTSSPRLKSGDS